MICRNVAWLFAVFIVSAGILFAASLTVLAVRPRSASPNQAPAAQSAGRAERTSWYFYRVKWGHQDEFVDLFQKNHYPC